MSKDCTGSHRYFVADVAVVEAAGKVCVITICTSCGDAQMRTFRVTEDNSETFYHINKKEKENVAVQR